MEESTNNATEQPVATEKTTTTSTTTTTTTLPQKPSEIKKVVEEVKIEEEKVVEEVKLHVRDFLLKTKAMRDEFNIFEKKFLAFGAKTVGEWEKLTGLIAKK